MDGCHNGLDRGTASDARIVRELCDDGAELVEIPTFERRSVLLRAGVDLLHQRRLRLHLLDVRAEDILFSANTDFDGHDLHLRTRGRWIVQCAFAYPTWARIVD